MRRADRRAFVLAYGAWLFGIFAFFIPGATWNPVSRFNLTRAIVERGSLSIDEDAESTGDRARVGEHWYSDKAPGVALLAAPAYAVVHLGHRLRGVKADYEAAALPRTPAYRFVPNRAYRQGLHVSSLATSGVGGVALGLGLFALLRRRTTSKVAFLASSVVVLGSPILPYSTSFYGHVPAAAFLLGALLCLDPRAWAPGAAAPTPRKLRIAGACLALAVLCEYLTIFPGLLVGAWFLIRLPAQQRIRAAGQLALGAALPAAVLAAYHTACFGAPWRTGYAFEDNPTFVAGHATGIMGIGLPSWAGLYGLTWGSRRGLFYLWPLLSLALMFAVLHALRRRDWTIGAGLGALATLYVANAGYYMWWGGASAGPRHLIPGLPFLAAGVALALSVPRRWLKRVVLAAGIVSIASSVAITGVGIEARERGDILRDHVLRKLRTGKVASFAGASNLGRELGLPQSPISLAPVVLWIAIGYGYLLLQLRRSNAAGRFGS